MSGATRSYTRVAIAIVIAAVVISASALSYASFGATVTKTVTTGTTTTSTELSTITSTKTVTTNTVTSTTLCVTPVSNTTEVYIVNCPTGVMLGLVAAHLILVGQNTTAFLSLTNDLTIARNVSYTGFPTLPGGINPSSAAGEDYVLPLLPPCSGIFPSASGYVPAFIAVYNSSGDTLQLNDSPPSLVSCVSLPSNTYRSFNASQTINDMISLGGYWTSSDASEPWLNATYSKFSPGNYTILAFDPWGQTTQLNFTVLTDIATGSYAHPANESFQFVQASVGNAESLAAINATFRSEPGVSGSVSIVAIAYPAETGNPYGLPNEVVCCPLVSSYSSTAAAVSSNVINAEASVEVSSSLLFSSLNGTYIVKLYITSPNGTLLSPVSTVFLQVAGGKVYGGQAGAGASFFDSDNGLLYVADSGVDAVSVINGSTSRLVATISLPDIIGDLNFYLYDPANHELYVGGQDSPEVFAIDTSTNFIVSKLITSQPGQSLQSMVYDPANGKVFGINFVYSIVAVINGTTNTIVANITGISGPLSGILDAKSNELLISAYNGTTFVINADTDRIIGSLQTSATIFFYDPDNSLLYGSSGGSMVALNATTFEQVGPALALPGGFVLYDHFNKDIYFYDGPAFGLVGGNLSAFSTTSNSVVASIPVPGLFEGLVIEYPSFVYDSGNGDIYATELTNPHNGTVGLLEISASSNTIVSQTFPPSMPLNGIVLDANDGMLYGTYGMGSSTIFGLNIASGAVSATVVGTAQTYTLLA